MPSLSDAYRRTAQKNPFGFVPVGAHTSNALISAATTLTLPEGANSILIQVSGRDLRYTLDGTTPTATLGFLLLSGSAPVRIDFTPGVILRVIESAATATLQYQFGRVEG